MFNKIYIVKENEKEFPFPSLKAARSFIRNIINVNEVKGIEAVYEIYKQETKRTKIDEAKSEANVVGPITKLMG